MPAVAALESFSACASERLCFESKCIAASQMTCAFLNYYFLSRSFGIELCINKAIAH